MTSRNRKILERRQSEINHSSNIDSDTTSNTLSTLSRRTSVSVPLPLLAGENGRSIGNTRNNHDIYCNKDERLRANIANMKQYVAGLTAASSFNNNNNTMSEYCNQSIYNNNMGTRTTRGEKYGNAQLLQSRSLFQQSTNNNKLISAPLSNVQMSPKKKGLRSSYTKDYIALARDYKRMQPYQSNNNEVSQNICICCRSMVPKSYISTRKLIEPSSNKLSKVFFPCEHLCVCDSCFEGRSWSTCPLCHQHIKVVFEHTGTETEDYWRWVNEIKPKLSNSFRKSFPRCSRKAITEAMARSIEDIEEEGDDSSDSYSIYKDDSLFDEDIKSKACIIS